MKSFNPIPDTHHELMQNTHQVQLLLSSTGHPGTGKSEIASHLARLLHLASVDKDDSRDTFEELKLHDSYKVSAGLMITSEVDEGSAVEIASL